MLRRNFVLIVTLSLLPMIPSRATAEETRRAWIETESLPAREAFQAAAADERFIYAISSTEVAKYDRATGECLVRNHGDAKHLNSGFLHEGRLYCAHSNFPQIPEQSDIKVLDLDSMQLTTFKDFGNYGGSLTWSVYHQGHWWCNFARYGKDNAETFLVKFDDQWNEKGRWTYPQEVIRDLGSYSISGGIWHNAVLLVTGHDERALFQLRLPEAGTVLEFLEKQPAPFAGQGIAYDPKTGGLVGIERAKRRVVFAKPE